MNGQRPAQLARAGRTTRIQLRVSEHTGEGTPLGLGQDRLGQRQTNVDLAANDSCLEDTQFSALVMHRPLLKIIPKFEHAIERRQGASAILAEQAPEARIVSLRRKIAFMTAGKHEHCEVCNIGGILESTITPAISNLERPLAVTRPGNAAWAITH